MNKYICIFPWLILEKPFKYNNIELITWSEGRFIDKENKENKVFFEKVLKVHKIHDELTISKCTLIKYQEQFLIEDFDETKRYELYTFAEVLAFSGLAERGFFSYDYTNKTSFTLHIYPYSEENESITIISRRRDGEKLTGMPLKFFSITEPVYSENSRGKVDIELISSIYRYLYNNSDINFLESIQIFNLANTDSDQFYNFIEITFLVGALERLLQVRNGRADLLVENFLTLVQPKLRVAPSASDRISKSVRANSLLKKNKSLTQLWLEDFYALRGQHAHGRIKSDFKSLWSLDEHTLYASFIFPLVLKVILSKRGYYNLTPKDNWHLNSFEFLLNINPFKDNDPMNHKYSWNEILRETSILVNP